VFVIIGLLLIDAIAWCMLSERISDNGSRINEIRADIRSVGEQQQAVAGRLEKIENGLSDSAAEAGRVSTGLEDVAKSVAGIEDRISASQDRVRDSAEIIREGQSIISGVRARGQVRD